MLTTTKPRSQTPRASHTPQYPPISYPLSSNRSSQSTVVPLAPASPPKTPPHGRRPSISNTMHWLSRSSTQSSSSPSYSPSKPTRISEPKLVRSIELLAQPRTGVLGAGATIVRTPDEALRETGVRLTYDGKASEPARENAAKLKTLASKDLQAAADDLPSPPNSPPLPPLPMPEDDEEETLEVETESVKFPPCPTRAPPPPPVPQHSALRPSLKRRSSSNAAADEPHNIPSLPVNVPTTPVPPPFRPLLVSELPSGVIDSSKVIVTLETCTTTYRTTLDTINSRSSHLSSYISSLLSRNRSNSTASSVYSTASDDMEAYRHHLSSQGFLAHTSSNIHVFLDRPSAPYAHILSYLRSSIGTPDCPEILPRAVQLHSSSNSRFEALVELRDEAAYLKLDALHKLCADEIRLRHGPRLHTRGNSSASTAGSVHSLHASVYSLHTLMERVESDIRSPERARSDSTGSQKSTKGARSQPVSIPARSPPTPQSWEGPRSRSRDRHSPSRSPPAGWI